MPSEIQIGDDSLTMTRVFAYPRAAVFAAFTDPEQLVHWWGCRDTEHVSAELEPRTGGRFRFVLKLNNGFEMVQDGVYEEFVPLERIVSRATVGEGTEFELTSTSTVEFADEGSGTRVTLTQRGLPPMPNACDIISTGTNDSFDKLERFLAG